MGVQPLRKKIVEISIPKVSIISFIFQIDRVIFCLFLPVDVDIYETFMQYYFPVNKTDTSTTTSPEEKGQSHLSHLQLNCSEKSILD